MIHIPVTADQMTRWRSIYALHATPQLESLVPSLRRCVMQMMQRAELVAAQGGELTDDACRRIFFASTVPGFPLRDDASVAACRLMMRDAAGQYLLEHEGVLQ